LTQLGGICRPYGLITDDLTVLIDFYLKISSLLNLSAALPILAEISLQFTFEKAQLGSSSQRASFTGCGTSRCGCCRGGGLGTSVDLVLAGAVLVWTFCLGGATCSEGSA
jgi:hypothetical protein